MEKEEERARIVDLQQAMLERAEAGVACSIIAAVSIRMENAKTERLAKRFRLPLILQFPNAPAITLVPQIDYFPDGYVRDVSLHLNFCL